MKKKLLLAMAVLGAAAWQGANAIVLKANDNEFANVGLELQIWAQNNGKVTDNDQSSNNFSVNNARVYFSGQINPIVQFGADLDFADNNTLAADGTARAHQGTSYTRVTDAFINFKFMPEVQLMAGLFRDPVSRLSNTDEYTYVIPTGFGYGFDTVWYQYFNNNSPYNSAPLAVANLLNPFTPITIGDDIQNANRDAGIAIWGNVADTMLKYYLFAANGAYDYQAGQQSGLDLNSKGNLKYGIRVEFTPTMLGYKNSSGFVDQDTFLGALNNLTIGLGYEQQKLDCGGAASGSLGYYMCDSNKISSLTPKYYDVDANWEQKFGTFVPQVQLGWAEKKDLGYGYNDSKIKSTGYYVQLAALYDQVVGLGKPGLAFRWENSKVDYVLPSSAKINRYSIFVNYYIAGEAAKLSLGADIVDPDSTLKAQKLSCSGSTCNYLKNFTDFTLALQTEF
jgi:hypothetical protein